MATYHFELTFDSNNPGTETPSDLTFGGKTRAGYPLGHTLYDANNKAVGPRAGTAKSHTFKAGDEIYIRLFALSGQSTPAPTTLNFDLQRVSSQGKPQPSAPAKETPFATLDGTALSGSALGKHATQYSLNCFQAKSKSLKLSNGKGPYPCWVLTTKTTTPDNDTGALAEFQHHPSLPPSSSGSSNHWSFQVWTHIDGKTFIFDPEMIVDPNL